MAFSQIYSSLKVCGSAIYVVFTIVRSYMHYLHNTYKFVIFVYQYYKKILKTPETCLVGSIRAESCT